VIAALRVLAARLAGLITGRSRDARLAEEVHAHLDALASEHRARGLSPDDARLAARRDFGGVDQMLEAHRDQHRPVWLATLAYDLRLALRRLWAEPWFSAAVVLALGIGIGGSVSVVGAVTAIAWSQPPFPDPDGVVSVGTIDQQGRRADLSWLDFQDWRNATRAFTGMAAFSGVFFTLGPDGRAAERVQGAYVSHEMFGVLGLQPERGRDFLPDDDRPGAEPVALVGHAIAESLLGGIDNAVGQTVLLDGVPTAVVGVMPPKVSFPLNGALWRPLVHQVGLRESARERRVLGAVGRLADGTSSAAALAELSTVAARPVPDAPIESEARVRPTLTTFRERFLGRSTDPVPLALLVVSAMVLLIGCATAATLLFARSAYRLDEATMRVALGASRSRLVAQLLAECAMCAGVAGLLGLGAAKLVLQRFGVELAGAGLPPWVQFTIETRVVAIAAVATLAATILGGLAPAWRLTGAAMSGAPGRSRTTDGRPTQRWIRSLLVANVALTLVLLSTSGNLLSGARALWLADQVVTADVVTARLGMSGPHLATPAQRLALTRRFVERLEGRRELEAVTVTTGPPFAGIPARRVAIDTVSSDPRDTPTARVAAIDAAYFETIGLGLVAGRSFSDREDPRSPVAVVNAAFATTHLGDEAIGRRLQLAPSSTEAPAGPWLTVVGVAPSMRHSPRPEADPAIYIPLAIEHPPTVFVMVRAAEGVPVADILRDELRTLDATSVLYGWQTLERLSEISRWTMRTVGAIVIALGGLALSLAALGIYAVTSYAAGRRVKEAGIRVAVGATMPDVVRLFVRGTLGPVGLGLALGLVGGWAASRALLALVLDGATVGAPMVVPAALVIGMVALVAAVVPARRVAVRDPLRALRCD
jgi:putative ABC transport system permease protein